MCYNASEPCKCVARHINCNGSRASNAQTRGQQFVLVVLRQRGRANSGLALAHTYIIGSAWVCGSHTHTPRREAPPAVYRARGDRADQGERCEVEALPNKCRHATLQHTMRAPRGRAHALSDGRPPAGGRGGGTPRGCVTHTHRSQYTCACRGEMKWCAAT